MRETRLKIKLAGKDISEDVEPYLRGLTYTDVLSGEADTLEITLTDVDKKFLGDWFPPRGSTLDVTLLKNWEVHETLELGEFEIDEVTYSTPPSVCKLKAVSIPQNSELRQIDESKSWEHVKLSEIARDIAEASKVELIYETDYDPEITRAEQGEQSRLAFLEKICADNGLCLKFSDGKLIVFEESKLESQEPAATLTWTDLKQFNGRATLQEVYKACEVNYKHGKQDNLYKARAEDKTKTEGKTLKINKKVDSQAEADRLAKFELRKKNKQELVVTLTLPLDVRLVAGNVVELKDFGFFNGKWLINRATINVDNGSTSRIELHKCEDKS